MTTHDELTNDGLVRAKMNREVYCPACRDYSFTDEVTPVCRVCKLKLITVIRSPLTGHRVNEVRDATDPTRKT